MNAHTSVHLAQQSELLIVEDIKAAQGDDSSFYILFFILFLQVTVAFGTVNTVRLF